MPAYHIAKPTRTAAEYYGRTLGKTLNRSGQVRPKMFTLGRDTRHAEWANIRLAHLWSDIEALPEDHRLVRHKVEDVRTVGR